MTVSRDGEILTPDIYSQWRHDGYCWMGNNLSASMVISIGGYREASTHQDGAHFRTVAHSRHRGGLQNFHFHWGSRNEIRACHTLAGLAAISQPTGFDTLALTVMLPDKSTPSEGRQVNCSTKSHPGLGVNISRLEPQLPVGHKRVLGPQFLKSSLCRGQLQAVVDGAGGNRNRLSPNMEENGV